MVIWRWAYCKWSITAFCWFYFTLHPSQHCINILLPFCTNFLCHGLIITEAPRNWSDISKCRCRTDVRNILFPVLFACRSCAPRWCRRVSLPLRDIYIVSIVQYHTLSSVVPRLLFPSWSLPAWILDKSNTNLVFVQFYAVLLPRL